MLNIHKILFHPVWSVYWLGYGLDIRGSTPGRRREVILFLFATASRPRWGPFSVLFNGHSTLFPRGLNVRSVKLTTHLNLVPRLKMGGAVPPFPHTSSWCGAWLSTGATLSFYLS